MWLLPQHRQIRDRLTAVREQHREINGDPARLMRRPADPAEPQRLNETPGQTGLVSQIGEQANAGMTKPHPEPHR